METLEKTLNLVFISNTFHTSQLNSVRNTFDWNVLFVTPAAQYMGPVQPSYQNAYLTTQQCKI